MAQGVLPSGTVSQASILDLTPDDLRLHRQAHFFAGIGGWPFALQLAGYGDLPCWTGSPPCQPFSVAGQQRGVDDERHLAPAWINLIRAGRPPVLFGEQVADAIRHGWLDTLFDALEAEGYTCGAAVLPACSVGAPHIRKRLFFGAVRLGIPRASDGKCGTIPTPNATRGDLTKTDVIGSVADTDCAGLFEQWWSKSVQPAYNASEYTGQNNRANPHHGFWSNAYWLGCRDGKFRQVEPGTQPLVDGLPGRVGRLRGYGNAIVPQLAAVFITAFMDFVLSFNSRKV